MTPDQLAKSGTEHGEQRALFAWAAMATNYGLAAADNDGSYLVAGVAKSISGTTPLGEQFCLPQLKWLHAIHNQGHGDKIRGAHAKAEGVKVGVSDLFLPVPIINPLRCGLYIEMKRLKGGVESDEQETFRNDMTAAGYKAVVCHGWREARQAIVEYLGLTR
jgi:hypothetical protein